MHKHPIERIATQRRARRRERDHHRREAPGGPDINARAGPMTMTSPQLATRPSAMPREPQRTGPQPSFHRSRRAWLPLLLALAWMLGTFGLFWTGTFADQVPNPGRLCLFIFAATAAFAAGYALTISRPVRPVVEPGRKTRTQDSRRIRQLVVAGGIYYFALGLALLAEYGATSPVSIWTSIQDPAQAYVNKFTVYQTQQETGRTNVAIQVLTLLGVLGTVLVPVLVINWRRLTTGVRFIGLAGIGTYSLFFLYIGTLKGLGDFVLMIGGGLMITSTRGWDRARRRARRRGATIMVAVVAALFLGYMVNNQADRAAWFGTQDRIEASPTVERIVGPHLADGVAAVVQYPTHGYLGLAYNLDTPFSWSQGMGSTPALASYVSQYLGVDPDRYPSYPERTEERTGWPAGMYWSTIYPWLASDLSFPGAVLFMVLLGGLLARTWRESLLSNRLLPTLIFVQLVLLVAYIPANNQLGMSRPSLIGFLTLVLLYLAAPHVLTSRHARVGGPGAQGPHPPGDPAGTTRDALNR
ncbi:hypothetical protein FXF53_15810 [Micromonospora sp. WP24]|uniref:hypothetical protein n=1 Tax=Micromonospora sp. WP24 TaxID=2604469 RepID=UPI0011D8E208|nr:hypothetical protein [Micromonospora sp. WP24]TYB99231.1 hypothetical protein FXF53_15810 [Micromonospora sp. WP24]